MNFYGTAPVIVKIYTSANICQTNALMYIFFIHATAIVLDHQ